MSDKGETVIVPPGTKKRRVYHTDPDCPSVKRIENPREWTLRGNLERLEECQYCSGETSPGEAARESMRDTCRTCEADLDDDGICGFCKRFDEVVG